MAYKIKSTKGSNTVLFLRLTHLLIEAISLTA